MTATKWPEVALGDVCDIQIGKTPPRARGEYWGPGSPWLSIADMNQGANLVTTKETITDRAIAECNCRRVEPGTVLLSFKLSVGKVGIARRAMYTNEAIAHLPVREPSRLGPEYLRRALEATDLAKGADRAAMGATLNKASLAEVPIPLPPIEHQRRITDVLDEADRLRDKRRASLDHLDSLTELIFLEAFGDPRTNPKCLPTITLGTVIRVKSGEAVRATDLRSDAPHPVYGGNGVVGFLDRFLMAESSIVVGRVGAYCGNVHVAPPRSWITDNALVVVERSQDLELPYLAWAMRLAHLNQYASQSGQPLVSGSRIYPVRILMPPVELQRRFEALADAVAVRRLASDRSAERLDELFASLQHRAFRGDL